MHDIVGVGRPQVAQVVESRFPGRDVGDVGPIRAAPVRRGHTVLDGVHREPEHAVDRSHPLRVAVGEVVVEGQDVHAVPGQRVQGRRHDRRQRLAFAGLHFDHPAAREGEGGHDLHVERPQADGAAGCFPHQGEERCLKRVESDAGLCPGAQLGRPLHYPVIGQAGDLVCEPGDVGERLVERAQVVLDRGPAESGEALPPTDAVAYARADARRCSHGNLLLIRAPGAWRAAQRAESRLAGRQHDGGYTRAD